MQARTGGLLSAATAMAVVGSGVTVSDDLVDYPVFTAQAIRYGCAAVLPAVGLRAAGRTIPMPRGRDWVWLLMLAATGQALYNVAVVQAVSEAEPAAVAVVIGSVPLVLTVAEAIRTRTPPTIFTTVGVGLVVTGAALVQGGGRVTMAGVLWSLLALACEAAFTLLAIPILDRLGPFGVSTHTCWIAAVQLTVVALVADGRDALPALAGRQIFAIAYLAVALTAVAFVLWYTAVQRIGPSTAGLFAGLIPVSAAITGLIPGLTTITPEVLGGTLIVGIGITIGLTTRRTNNQEPTPSAATPASRFSP